MGRRVEARPRMIIIRQHFLSDPGFNRISMFDLDQAVTALKNLPFRYIFSCAAVAGWNGADQGAQSRMICGVPAAARTGKTPVTATLETITDTAAGADLAARNGVDIH